MELKRLLEPLYRRAIERRDYKTEKMTESILISLNKFLGEIREISLKEKIPITDRVDIRKIVGAT
jgi:hypothetical protein